MGVGELTAALDGVLPDQRVLDDLRGILAEGAEGDEVQIELDDRWQLAPLSTCTDIITKTFFKEYCEGIGFGSFRVQVAVGPVRVLVPGVLESEYCVATLYYDDAGEMFTIDFHKEFRDTVRYTTFTFLDQTVNIGSYTIP